MNSNQHVVVHEDNGLGGEYVFSANSNNKHTYVRKIISLTRH